MTQLNSIRWAYPVLMLCGGAALVWLLFSGIDQGQDMARIGLGGLAVLNVLIGGWGMSRVWLAPVVVETEPVLTDREAFAAPEEKPAPEPARDPSEFLAYISHEVRTPLNGIIGMFELIARADIPQRHRERAWRGREAAQNLFLLLSKVLDASRLEANAVEVRPAELSVSDLASFAETTASAALAKQERQVTVVVTQASGREMFRTDPTLLRQILMNLIDNAARFTMEGRIHIDFSIDPTGRDMRISVEDTGIGVPEDQVPHIFDRYRQAGAMSSLSQNGTGLGLSISRDMATLLKGELSYEPRHPSGSRFVLKLPGCVTQKERENVCEQSLAC